MKKLILNIYIIKELKNNYSLRDLLSRSLETWKVIVDFDRSARPAKKKAIDGAV